MMPKDTSVWHPLLPPKLLPPPHTHTFSVFFLNMCILMHTYASVSARYGSIKVARPVCYLAAAVFPRVCTVVFPRVCAMVFP